MPKRPKIYLGVSILVYSVVRRRLPQSGTRSDTNEHVRGAEKREREREEAFHPGPNTTSPTIRVPCVVHAFSFFFFLFLLIAEIKNTRQKEPLPNAHPSRGLPATVCASLLSLLLLLLGKGGSLMFPDGNTHGFNAPPPKRNPAKHGTTFWNLDSSKEKCFGKGS